MRVLCGLLIIGLMGSLVAAADSLEGQGIATGRVVLWFSGTSATGTFDADFALSGNVVLEDQAVPFSASGWTRGQGAGDTATMDVEAWATFAAAGKTDSGLQISVQGGLTLSALSADAAGSAGTATGEFYATVFLGDLQYRVQGSAEGSASGAFVVPEDPYSMELEGQGTFTLTGELVLVPIDAAVPDAPEAPAEDAQISAAASLPWETLHWPEELLAELLDILSHTVEIPATVPDGS